MSDAVDLTAFRAAFLAEANEQIRTSHTWLVQLAQALRKGESSPLSVRNLYRAVHTLKGVAAMVELEPIVELAHGMEAVLRAGDRAEGRLPPGALEPLVEAMKAIEQRVGALAHGREPGPAPAGLVRSLAALQSEPSAARDPAPTRVSGSEILARLAPAEQEQLQRALAAGRTAWTADFVPSAERAAAGLGIAGVSGRLASRPDTELVKVIPASTPAGLKFTLLFATSAPIATLAPTAEMPLDAIAPVSVSADEPDEAVEVEAREPGVVRVPVARVEDAMEHLSGLLVSAATLRRAWPGDRESRRLLDDQSRRLRDLRAALLALRMVPVTDLLAPLPLLVRGLRGGTDKSVRLSVQGGHAELDKGVAERVFPAIVHLIRNAVDHGIEPVEERRRVGKPDEGVVRVVCRGEAETWLEIEVEDDGRGIDPIGLAARAGRPVPETERGLLDLLAIPGLTTRDRADRTSGRGMGVDIVRRIVVEQLRGEVRLSTRPGAGTCFTLRLPVSLTVLEAFAFQSGEQAFLVPMSMVDAVIAVEQGDAVAAPGGGSARLLHLQGVGVPLVELDDLLRRARTGHPHRKALVMRREGARFAVAVDRLLGKHEVVVRPVTDPLVRMPGVSGVADLGDGRPTLLLDLPALFGRLTEPRAT